jgi:hypothetical protein
MSTPRSLAHTLEFVGRTGRRIDRWAAGQSRAHHRRLLTELGVFDGTTFGYRYRLGGMGRLAQYRPEWWSEALTAADDAGVDRIVLRTDQVRWLLAKTGEEGRA